MKKIWLKIQGFFITLFGSERKLEQFLIDHADEAIAVFTNVRNVIEGPYLDAIEFVTPPEIDAKIENARTKVEAILDQVMLRIAPSQACLTLPTFPERFECFVIEIRKFSETLRNGAIFKGASAYTQISAEGEKVLKESQTDMAVITRLAEMKIDSGSWTSEAA